MYPNLTWINIQGIIEMTGEQSHNPALNSAADFMYHF